MVIQRKKEREKGRKSERKKYIDPDKLLWSYRGRKRRKKVKERYRETSHSEMGTGSERDGETGLYLGTKIKRDIWIQRNGEKGTKLFSDGETGREKGKETDNRRTERQ